MKRRDLSALVLLGLWLAGLMAFRARYVEPREWAAACAGADPAALVCGARGALLWMQEFGAWGWGALALGLAGFLGAPFAVAVAAIAVGAGGVVNYNASFGMLGLALGAWAWISPAGRPRAAATRGGGGLRNRA